MINAPGAMRCPLSKRSQMLLLPALGHHVETLTGPNDGELRQETLDLAKTLACKRVTGIELTDWAILSVALGNYLQVLRRRVPQDRGTIAAMEALKYQLRYTGNYVRE